MVHVRREDVLLFLDVWWLYVAVVLGLLLETCLYVGLRDHGSDMTPQSRLDLDTVQVAV